MMNMLKKVFPGGSGGTGEKAAAAFSFVPVAFDAASPPTPKCVCTIPAHDERVWMVAWHPSGNILASCSSDKTVKLWSPSGTEDNAWRCIATLDGEHSRTVRCIQWSPDGERLACSSFDATVSVWKRSSPQFDMEPEGMLDGHENEVKSVAWRHDGKYLATCSRDKSVWVWESQPETGEWECAGAMHGHTQDVKCVRWAPHTNVLFSCGYDDTVKVWEETPGRRDDWHCSQTLVQHTSTVWEVAPQPVAPSLLRNHLLLSCSDDASVIIWMRTGAEERWTPVRTVTGVHDRTIFSVDWAPIVAGPCSTVFACASGDDSFSIMQLVPSPSSAGDSGAPFSVAPVAVVREAHSSDVNCIRFCPVVSPGGALRFATCSDDGTIKIFELPCPVPADEEQ